MIRISRKSKQDQISTEGENVEIQHQRSLSKLTYKVCNCERHLFEMALLVASHEILSYGKVVEMLNRQLNTITKNAMLATNFKTTCGTILQKHSFISHICEKP